MIIISIGSNSVIFIDCIFSFYFSLDAKDEKDVSLLVNDSSAIKRIDADFHFFSDTELTNNSILDSRAGSPINIESVQSDSEFEVKGRKGWSCFVFFIIHAIIHSSCSQ